MLSKSTQTVLASVLTSLALTGCADEPTVDSGVLNATEETATEDSHRGEAVLLSTEDADVAVHLRTSGALLDFTAGRETCLMGNQPQGDDRPWLLCDSIYLIHSAEGAVEGRLAGRYTDSQPICREWESLVGPAVPESLCFPAGEYVGDASEPSIALTLADESGDHPFAVAALIDEAVSELVGLTTRDGRVVSMVQWHVYSGDLGALNLRFAYEDGSQSEDCSSTSAPRILTEDGTLDPMAAVDAYAELLRDTTSDTFCDL